MFTSGATTSGRDLIPTTRYQLRSHHQRRAAEQTASPASAVVRRAPPGGLRPTRNAWSAPAIAATETPGRRRSCPGVPKGSRDPWTTSTGPDSPAATSSAARLTPGLPGGWSGNASATTAEAPTTDAVRQATLAPALRPPASIGRSRPHWSRTHARARATAGTHASSSCAGAGATRRPETRQGCSTLTTQKPKSGSWAAIATRSGASTPPPAPWPSTSSASGRPSGGAIWSRAGPRGVDAVTAPGRAPRCVTAAWPGPRRRRPTPAARPGRPRCCARR